MFFSNIKYPRQIDKYHRPRDKKLYYYADAANRSAIVNKTINEHFGKGESIRFLDAGGSKRDLLSDVSKVSYSINIAQDSFVGADHVDHFAVANIEKIPFVDNAFDVVCCSNVLEHVSQPIVCVEEMLRVTKPNGLLFIEGPIPNSLQGLITRFTPFLFHVWVYRALGVKTAGTPGKAPFPTFFAPGSDPDDIYDRLQNRCTLIESSLYTSVHTKRLKNKSTALFKIYDAVDFALSVVTFGKIIHGRSDFVFILRKNIAEHGL